MRQEMVIQGESSHRVEAANLADIGCCKISEYLDCRINEAIDAAIIIGFSQFDACEDEIDDRKLVVT